MPNLITEKLEKILDEKLSPLSEQLKEALAMVKSLNTKYEKMEETLGVLQEENKALKEEHASLKAQVLSSANDLKSVQKSPNDLEQYTRRDCVEICGIPLPEESQEEDTNEIVLQLSQKMGIPLERKDISVSHRIRSSRSSVDPAIIVKFVRREVRERLYRARKRLKSITMADFGFSVDKKIFINESLTPKNKELFKDCLRFKKDNSFKFLWTNAGKIFLRRNADSPVILINSSVDIPPSKKISHTETCMFCDKCPGRVPHLNSSNCPCSYASLPRLDITSSISNIDHLI